MKIGEVIVLAEPGGADPLFPDTFSRPQRGRQSPSYLNGGGAPLELMF